MFVGIAYLAFGGHCRMNSAGRQPVRRPRHLMDPANPVRQVNDHRLTQVQRWVVSVLAVTTILHLAVGLGVAAYFLDDQKVSSRVGRA
jgi:hypothetical protein